MLPMKNWKLCVRTNAEDAADVAHMMMAVAVVVHMMMAAAVAINTVKNLRFERL